ncbi:hypothetical protein ACNI65_06470 [Roseateles sp. So40a]|uniref:hypothetical protein n=1 Tax=Roseateles sp. So40a TaxID=3400226 RepID=UPI003A88AFF1
MLVRALCLRRLGVKLSAEELRASSPMAGVLRMNRSLYAGRDGRGKDVCLLMPNNGEVRPLVELFDARLIRIEPRGLLIGGEEDFWNRKRKTSYPQVLWCWPEPPPLRDEPPRASIGSPEVARLLEALDAIA